MRKFVQSILKAMFIILIFIINGCEPDQDRIKPEWTELGGINTSVFNSRIFAIAPDASGNVFVDALLLTSNNSRYLAKWNKRTNSWSEIGVTQTSPFNGGFMAPLASDVDGNIFACGITRAPPERDNFHVAKWDGISWSELGGTNQPSFNGSINNIITDPSGNVYVSGDSIVLGNTYFVAKWDKSSDTWYSLGDFTGTVGSLVIDATGNLYAGGKFLNGNGSPYVAKLEDLTWHEIGGGNSSNFNILQITSIVIDKDGNIYTAGCLNKNNDDKNISRWDKNTNTWSFLSSQLPSHGITSMIIDDVGHLYAVGDLHYSDENNVYKWNGFNWINYGNLNANNTIFLILRDEIGNIYAGGAFTNGNNKFYVAVYK